MEAAGGVVAGALGERMWVEHKEKRREGEVRNAEWGRVLLHGVGLQCGAGTAWPSVGAVGTAAFSPAPWPHHCCPHKAAGHTTERY